MKKVLGLLIVVAAFGVTGCGDSGPEPTTAPVQQEGQSARERAMQGMPDNMREQYENQEQ